MAASRGPFLRKSQKVLLGFLLRPIKISSPSILHLSLKFFLKKLLENYVRDNFSLRTQVTSQPSPRLRLLFVAVALILRNMWVWIHQTRLAEGTANNLKLHLERLRFKQMLDWIVHEIVALFHDGSGPYVEWDP